MPAIPFANIRRMPRSAWLDCIAWENPSGILERRTLSPIAYALLESYPNIPWPIAPPRISFESWQRTLKLVESGCLSSAARSLTGQFKIADVMPEAIKSLRSKFPLDPTTVPLDNPDLSLAKDRTLTT